MLGSFDYSDALSSMVEPMRKAVVRDLTEVRVKSVKVVVPTRATVLTRSVWTFRLEAEQEAFSSKGFPEVAESVTRTLDDFAWLRRALVFAVPGCMVPPGPLVSFASSRDATASGEAPLSNEEAEALRESAQRSLKRLLGHAELRDEPLLKSFCFDEPEQWEARKREAENALQVAPAMVQIGAKWSFATETMGIMSSETIRMSTFDRQELDTFADWQKWVVTSDEKLRECERAARIDADAALKRAKATSRLLEVLAETADDASSSKEKEEESSSSTTTTLRAIFPPEEEEEEDDIADPKSLVVSAHASLLRELADLRSYLAAAQEALNMRDLCRRESWTAARHCAETHKSFKERQAQEDAAKKRQEKALEASSFESLSLAAHSTFASYHADAMLAKKSDVQKAEKLDGLLRHRFDIAKIRLYAHLHWLKDSWSLRCKRALYLYAKLDLARRSLTANHFQRALTNLLALSTVDDSIVLPDYQAPDFAKELANLRHEQSKDEVFFVKEKKITDILEPTRTTNNILQDDKVTSATTDDEHKPDTIVVDEEAAI